MGKVKQGAGKKLWNSLSPEQRLRMLKEDGWDQSVVPWVWKDWSGIPGLLQMGVSRILAKHVIPVDMKMTCTHVLEEGAMPEYHEEDDCYTCSACRDLTATPAGKDEIDQYLKFVHQDCLQEVLKSKGVVIR